MAHDVKIDVYTIMIKEHGKEIYNNFNEIRFIDEYSKEKGIDFMALFKKYIKSFNKEFVVQEATGKAIFLASKRTKLESSHNTITGIFEGGTTGIGSTIKSRKNADDDGSFKVHKESVNSLPYYFKMWLPEEGNVGILLMQGLGSKSMSEVVKSHLKSFFATNTRGQSLQINTHIPKELEEKMIEDGTINSITLRRYKLPSDKAEKIIPNQNKIDNSITIEIKISGLGKFSQLKKAIKSVITGNNNTFVNIEPFEDLGMDGNHETFIQFKHGDKIATGKLDKNFTITPSYYLEESDFKRDSDNIPTFESLDKYCSSFLEAMKKEIGYK